MERAAGDYGEGVSTQRDDGAVDHRDGRLIPPPRPRPRQN